MLGTRLLVATAILLFAECSYYASSEKVTTTIMAPTSSTTDESATKASPMPLQILCETCSCTDDSVNCTERDLQSHFADAVWPSKPLAEVTFVGNFLIDLKPFPNVAINRLILRNNRITKIDDKAFKEIRNLTELDLSRNELTSELLTPNVFEGRPAVETWEPLEKLIVLNLANNDLHTLNQDLFAHVGNLKVLILSGNPFDVIDHGTTIALSGLPYLEELDLSECNLRELTDHLFHAPRHLKTLRLNGNQFLSPPSALEDCQALEYLNMDENPFELLDRTSAFPNMTALKELSICCLPRLAYVGDNVFSKLTALESLNLQNCPRLKHISENALVGENGEGATWPPLKTLDLSDNSLRYLPRGLVGRWDHLDKLDIMNNEWSCDCDNQYLIGSLLPSLDKKVLGNETDNLKCSAPPEHAGKNLTSLANRTLRCLDLYDARPERDAAILVGIMIGLLLAIPIALTLFVFWRKGFFFCGAQGPASFSRAFYKRASNDDEI